VDDQSRARSQYGNHKGYMPGLPTDGDVPLIEILVDRATGCGRVPRGEKISRLVDRSPAEEPNAEPLGHGCRVGQHNVLAAQVGLAGSTRVENHVMLGGQVGAAGHLTIGDGVVATAQTGIARSVPAGSKISGTPEMDSSLWKKNYLLLHQLPELTKTIRRLEKEIEALKATSAAQSKG
jgi:UDP-3-O-[3-hydroxymyristoyl] glucosamine N-acyltransferase